MQMIISHHGTEDDLHTRDIPVKTTVEEGVVHQAKLFDLLKVLVLILLAGYDNHLNSHALPIFYRDFHFFARMSFFLRTKHIISNLRSGFFLCLLHDVRIKISCNGDRAVPEDFGSRFHGNAGLQNQGSTGFVDEVRVKKMPKIVWLKLSVLP